MTTWQNRIVGHGDEDPESLLANPGNWRIHPRTQQDAMTAALADVGWIQTVIVNQTTGHMVDGHLRVSLALRRGEKSVPVTYVELSEAEEALALATFDPITAMATADRAQLDALLRDVSTGEAVLQEMLSDLADREGVIEALGDAGTDTAERTPPASLAERFIVPPFSVLDARQGYWQDRKRSWLALGIKSELGRGEGLISSGGSAVYGGTSDWAGDRGPARAFAQDLMRGEHVVGGKKANAAPGGSPDAATRLGPDGKTVRGDGAGRMGGRPPHGPSVRQNPDGTLDYAPSNNGDGTANGTSIFDPVLCELAYRWFAPPGGAILDPFAGGSVRGVVAGMLGHPYTGVDLSERQIEANRLQWADIGKPDRPAPNWIVGDSRTTIPTTFGEYDLIFSCPPYADLEVYSDDPADLSTMAYADFLAAYREIIAAAAAKLRDGRFACFVVGDLRDKAGNYRDFPGDTIDAFRDAGMALYNEAILVTALGSLPIRAGRQFAASRKLGKTHQNVLVFVKGTPPIAEWGEVESGDVAEMFGEVA